ncbi:MAG: dUTP diphosphatase [Nitrospirae bacterium]|nr:dUTP diphosphatase [Nitrospirota bacterium]
MQSNFGNSHSGASAPGALRVRRLVPAARLPRRVEAGAAGYDLYACGDQEGRLIATGIALEIPAGWVGIVKDRSGVALSGRGFTVAGVIDSSYRGEIKIVFDRDIKVQDGERIAQLVIVPHFSGEVMEADTLSDTARGGGGFGSSGRGTHD